MRSETSSPSSTAWGEPTGPSRQILAVVPEQLWLGRNLWHVSRRPPQAMIHGVLEKCFVLRPRGQFVGGSPMGLHTRQLPSLLTPGPRTSCSGSPVQPGRPGSLHCGSERAVCELRLWARPKHGEQGLPAWETQRDRSWCGKAAENLQHQSQVCLAHHSTA